MSSREQIVKHLNNLDAAALAALDTVAAAIFISSVGSMRSTLLRDRPRGGPLSSVDFQGPSVAVALLGGDFMKGMRLETPPVPADS